jgi:DNA-binding IclR family transcriptional regulator
MKTPTTTDVSERALLMLEIIARAEEPPTLNDLIAMIGLPKATTHRFVTRLEKLGFAQRTMDGKRFGVGHRLTSLALDAMRHSIQLAPRRAILAGLVEEIGETCNITMLDGTELIYLDRVESDWPLQIRLKTGSRVPLHCTASGKLFLSLTPDSFRKALFESRPLLRHTPRTIVDVAALETELNDIRRTKIGTDEEEFIEGMTAAAVPVMDNKGKICATVAVHGPTVRLPLQRALALVPALSRAAKAIEDALHGR